MWGVAIAVVVGGMSAVAKTTEASPVRAIGPGAVLRLPRPGALPCRRFLSAMAEAFDDANAPPSEGQDDEISLEWRAGGRRFRVGTGPSFKTGPLPASGLPRAVVLVSRRPHDKIGLTLSCNDDPDETSDRYDVVRFVGIGWLCTSAGCRAEAGYPLPARLARSPRRLRLCASPTVPDPAIRDRCDRHQRDVRPAFVDAGGAMALAHDILSDARRATEDACRVAGGCNRWVGRRVSAVRPADWRATSWRVWARNQPVEGDEGMQLTVSAGPHTLNLECWARPNGMVQGCWLEAQDREGGRLFNYEPIDEEEVPEARLERSSGDDIVLSADPENQIPPACSLSSDALRAR